MRVATIHSCAALAIVVALSSSRVVAGAEPSNESEAMRRAAPIIAALDKFRRNNGHYPNKLDELIPRYLRNRAQLHYSAEEVFGYSSDQEYLLNFHLYGPHGGPRTAFSRCYLSDEKKWHYWGPY